MKLAYIVRNSSVIPSSFNSKNWREIILLNWLNTSNYKAKLLTTDFDHYALSKRKSIIPQFRDLIVQFKDKILKSVSLYRLFNAIYFGFNTFLYLALHAKRSSLIIVSLPTPESTLAVLFAAKLKNLGFSLILEIIGQIILFQLVSRSIYLILMLTS